MDKDIVLAEGYKEYDTGREYMARMGDWRNNKDEEINLDGIGGVNILVKADVHRSGMPKAYITKQGKTLTCTGINFPCYAFENQAETEGFAKMAKRAGYEVVGLPNYVVWVSAPRWSRWAPTDLQSSTLTLMRNPETLRKTLRPSRGRKKVKKI